jgi:hypothetical protein
MPKRPEAEHHMIRPSGVLISGWAAFITVRTTVSLIAGC